MTRAVSALVMAACMLCKFANEAASADDVATQLQSILKVDKEGRGHATAVAALKDLSQQPTTALVLILQAMDDANPLAENWLRGAFQAIADRRLREGGSLPQKELEQFALDRSHAPQSRRLAFEWLVRIDPSAADRLIPGMVNDPSADFRRKGAQRLLEAAKKAAEARNTEQTKRLYAQVFQSALDPDQLDLAFDELTKLGEKPDLKARLGLLNEWWVIGPFDHRGGIGFDAVYPPEKEIDLEKKYTGTADEVRWVKKQSDVRHGVVDLNQLIGTLKGVAGYAYCEFESEKAQPIELRIGTPNGWKLWMNGELLFAHEEYHLANRMDQYRVKSNLKAGTNKILLKVCQNEQMEDWTRNWEFQMRVCDPYGSAVLPRNAGRPDPSSLIGRQAQRIAVIRHKAERDE